MDSRDILSEVLAMTAGEFKAFKRALAILRRAGVFYDDATRILIESRLSRRATLRDIRRNKPA